MTHCCFQRILGARCFRVGMIENRVGRKMLAKAPHLLNADYALSNFWLRQFHSDIVLTFVHTTASNNCQLIVVTSLHKLVFTGGQTFTTSAKLPKAGAYAYVRYPMHDVL